MPATVSATASSRGPTAALACQEPFETPNLLGVEGPAVGPSGEALEARPPTGLLLGGGPGRPCVAGEERRGNHGERSEVHRREMQLFHLVGRRRLSLRDTFESVRAGLRRELPGPHRRRRRRCEDPPARLAPGTDAVGEGRPLRPLVAVPGEAEQVGDGVVVLGRSQGQRSGVPRGSAPGAVRLAARGPRGRDGGTGHGQHRPHDSMSHEIRPAYSRTSYGSVAESGRSAIATGPACAGAARLSKAITPGRHRSPCRPSAGAGPRRCGSGPHDEHRRPAFERAEPRSLRIVTDDISTTENSGVWRAMEWRPQRDSNPCLSLERAES